MQVPRHQAHIVWRNLYRLGVALPDLPDAFGDVFGALSQDPASYEKASDNCLIMYRFCVRVAVTYLAKKPRTDDAPVHRVPRLRHRVSAGDAQQVLDHLTPRNRVVLVMYEIEGMSGYDISEVLNEPLQEVHTCLMAARVELEDALSKWRRSSAP